MVRSLGCAMVGVCWLACAPAAAPETGGSAGAAGGEASGGESAGGGGSAPVARCPATFEEALRVSACLLGPSLDACTYDRGGCECSPPPQCGGAQRPDPPPGTPGTWTCRSPDPSLTRADGCPLSSPPDASACGEPRDCDYTVCSWNQLVAHCEGGRWRVERRMSAPPP